MYNTILFDLDGTITDPKIGITKSVQVALEYLGKPEPDIEKLTCFIGPPLRDQLVSYAKVTKEKAQEGLLKYRERFQTVGLFENEEYPYVREMLKHLKAAGKRLAIATSKPRVFAERIMDHFNLTEYFDLIMGCELDGTRELKAEVIKEVLNRFVIEEEQLADVIMIGDRSHDIVGAKANGIDSAGVLYGYGTKEELLKSQADYIVASVQELEQLLLQ